MWLAFWFVRQGNAWTQNFFFFFCFHVRSNRKFRSFPDDSRALQHLRDSTCIDFTVVDHLFSCRPVRYRLVQVERRKFIPLPKSTPFFSRQWIFAYDVFHESLRTRPNAVFLFFSLPEFTFLELFGKFGPLKTHHFRRKSKRKKNRRSVLGKEINMTRAKFQGLISATRRGHVVLLCGKKYRN